MDAKKPSKRRQISNACMACRRAHRACDAEKPCHRCVTKGLNCTSEEDISHGFVNSETNQSNRNIEYLDNYMNNYNTSPSASEVNNNLFGFSDIPENNCSQTLLVQRIEKLEYEVQQLNQLIRQVVQPNNTPSSLAAYVKWDLTTQRIIGCNDAFFTVFGVNREVMPIFEQLLLNNTSRKVKFILEKLNSGARLVEVKAVFKQRDTLQEKCAFLQFIREPTEPTEILTNIMEIAHYDNEYKVDDYTQFPTFFRQCYTIAVENAALPWQCCGADATTVDDILPSDHR